MIKRLVLFLIAAYLCQAGPAYSGSLPPDFAKPAGQLEPKSGIGRQDTTIYFPDIRFPIEQGPAYLNSQVYRPGGDYGGRGGSGSQCDSANYSYPWRDTYCELRRWDMKLCPSGKGHQGDDIRPATCKKDAYWAVAVENGIIANVGTFSVTLQTASGRLYRYLHINMNELAVSELDQVNKGDRIGKVSNFYTPGTPTTIHLHFEVKASTGYSKEVMFLPPYTSLVAAYKRLMEQQP
jgi:murein DD-endopeptidase MepM/ murein hydrolase activator NlpD